MELFSFIPKGKEEAVTVPGVRDTTVKKRKTSLRVNGRCYAYGGRGKLLAKCLVQRPLGDILQDGWQTK